MAVAHVVGAAAFLMSHFPNCTNNQIRNAMIGSTTKPPRNSTETDWDEQYGWGIVNVGMAYELLTKGCVYAGGVYPNSTEKGILSGQAGGGKYQIAIRELTPTNAVTASPIGSTLTCGLFDLCGATLDTWLGIGGNTIYHLVYGTNYFSSTPSVSIRLTELLDSQSNIGDNYGSRIKGWLKPPVTGDYTFWIASDDEGELWLSTDSSSLNKVRVCYQPDSSAPGQWDEFPQQKSHNISLAAGHAYYYEVRGCDLINA